MGKPVTLIFDFDGTLADTFGIGVIEFRKLFKNNKQLTDDATIEKLRGMTAREAFNFVGIKWWQLPKIAYRAREVIRREIVNIKSFDGMSATLRQLHDDGVSMMIVSSNSTKNIHVFLQNNQMEGYFEHVYGGSGVFDKAKALKRIMRHNGLNPAECVYIGDEARDMEAARRADMRSVGVTWGFNNRHALEITKPEVLIDKPKDLLRLFGRKS